MTEAAVVLPVVAFVTAAVIIAFFAVFRAMAADWGVFVTGAATGAYGGPVDVRHTVPWTDIRQGLGTASSPGERQVRSYVRVTVDRPFMFGLRIVERQSGEAVFRLWRFYPGKPPGAWR